MVLEYGQVLVFEELEVPSQSSELSPAETLRSWGGAIAACWSWSSFTLSLISPWGHVAR